LIVASAGARQLARTLWEFFEFRLTCRLPSIDPLEPNTVSVNVEKFLESRKLGDLEPEIVVRDNERREVGLVHELLHLDLIQRGYPRFRLWTANESQWNVAGSVINRADHHLMLPSFVSFGYNADQFVGQCGKPSSDEALAWKHPDALSAQLETPAGYSLVVSECLVRCSLRHEAVWIKDLAVE
jgi:hypothetical protein